MDEILISGYYGFKNSGDDALLLSIINDLKKYKKEVKIVVLSYNPKETSAIYGVESINRFNIFKIIYAMIRSKMLISGGGTLIQDGTSTKSLIYYLSIISMAKCFGLKVMLYSNGIGPIKHKNNEKYTRHILNKVDLITLRDKASQKELMRIGVDKPKIVLTADPAFTLTPSDKKVGENILNKLGVPKDKRIVCVSVRKWNTLNQKSEDCIAKVIDYAVDKYNLYPVFLPMQPKKDYEISNRIANKMTNKSSIIKEEQNIGDTLSIISNMDLCIGMRLHTLIYSASQGVPLIGLVYDPKISGFMDYMNQRIYKNVEDVDFESLKSLIDYTMNNYNSIKSDLESRMQNLKTKAEQNAKYAVELLEK